MQTKHFLIWATTFAALVTCFSNGGTTGLLVANFIVTTTIAKYCLLAIRAKELEGWCGGFAIASIYLALSPDFHFPSTWLNDAFFEYERFSILNCLLRLISAMAIATLIDSIYAISGKYTKHTIAKISKLWSVIEGAFAICGLLAVLAFIAKDATEVGIFLTIILLATVNSFLLCAPQTEDC